MDNNKIDKFTFYKLYADIGVAFTLRLLSFQRAAFTKIPYRNCGKHASFFCCNKRAKN